MQRFFKKTVKILCIDGGGFFGCSEDMDDASAENMDCLKRKAEQIILEQSSSLERMVRLLK